MPTNATSSHTKPAHQCASASTVSPLPPFTAETNGPATNEIRGIASRLDRMENKALSSQRVVLSEEKTDKMLKLAFCAKLDRALDRRMSSQDAVMRPRAKNTAANEKLNKKAQRSGRLADGAVPEPQRDSTHTEHHNEGL
ncbi:hypothetical protein NW767_015124 [Fusarium falciforme]|uniref:Uncharacterized protein n=1 Tax=Fusarium falciforme TaxID=195108 RepID=A0A9W8UT48_9HYPO|nr:hypothetical protein NW755_014257 [Fusarium falciforme]KAJ4177425.1 hypothetical protein NW767_015124 [Fusarium falciforme]